MPFAAAASPWLLDDIPYVSWFSREAASARGLMLGVVMAHALLEPLEVHPVAPSAPARKSGATPTPDLQAVVKQAIREGIADIVLLSELGGSAGSLARSAWSWIDLLDGQSLSESDLERVSLYAYAIAMERASRAAAQLAPHDFEGLALAVEEAVSAAFAFALRLAGPTPAPAPAAPQRFGAPAPNRRLAAVRALLDGRDPEAAGREVPELLDYPFGGTHLAVLAWTESPSGCQDISLRALVSEAARRGGAVRSLAVNVDDSTVWAWLALPEGADEFDLTGFSRLVPAGAHLVLSDPHRGLAGFRAAHRQAVRTRQLVRTAPPECRHPVTTTAEAGAVALMVSDLPGLAEWVQTTLGELAVDAPGRQDLRETLRVYLKLGGSLAEAGRELYLHRNTVLRRVKLARSLLPADGRDCAHLQTALDACRLVGAPVLGSAWPAPAGKRGLAAREPLINLPAAAQQAGCRPLVR